MNIRGLIVRLIAVFLLSVAVAKSARAETLPSEMLHKQKSKSLPKNVPSQLLPQQRWPFSLEQAWRKADLELKKASLAESSFGSDDLYFMEEAFLGYHRTNDCEGSKFTKETENRYFWVFRYGLKEFSDGGQFCVFIDATTNHVVGVTYGE